MAQQVFTARIGTEETSEMLYDTAATLSIANMQLSRSAVNVKPVRYTVKGIAGDIAIQKEGDIELTFLDKEGYAITIEVTFLLESTGVAEYSLLSRSGLFKGLPEGARLFDDNTAIMISSGTKKYILSDAAIHGMPTVCKSATTKTEGNVTSEKYRFENDVMQYCQFGEISKLVNQSTGTATK